MKFLIGISGGFILTAIGTTFLGLMFSAWKLVAIVGAISFWVIWVIGFVVAITSASAAKAWRKLWIASAILLFLLPIAALIFTGDFVAENYAGSAVAEAAGVAPGGGLLVSFLGFVGLFLGIAFFVIGFLVERDQV